MRPRAGLYIAAFEVIYLDYFKKIAVYWRGFRVHDHASPDR
jgi:hypothetical protein